MTRWPPAACVLCAAWVLVLLWAARAIVGGMG